MVKDITTQNEQMKSYLLEPFEVLCIQKRKVIMITLIVEIEVIMMMMIVVKIIIILRLKMILIIMMIIIINFLKYAIRERHLMTRRLDMFKTNSCSSKVSFS